MKYLKIDLNKVDLDHLDTFSCITSAKLDQKDGHLFVGVDELEGTDVLEISQRLQDQIRENESVNQSYEDAKKVMRLIKDEYGSMTYHDILEQFEKFI